MEKNKSNGEGLGSMELNFAGGFEGTEGRLQEASRMIDFSFSEPGKARSTVASNGASDLVGRRAISSAGICHLFAFYVD